MCACVRVRVAFCIGFHVAGKSGLSGLKQERSKTQRQNKGERIGVTRTQEAHKNDRVDIEQGGAKTHKINR
eukprot:7751114-Alexandrium_andersonii.AAC.1